MFENILVFVWTPKLLEIIEIIKIRILVMFSSEGIQMRPRIWIIVVISTIWSPKLSK